MSGQQAALTTFRTPADPSPHEGQATAADWQPGDHGRCLACGARIDPEVARVCGDNNGNVPVCGQCKTDHSGRTYQGTAQAVRKERDEVAPR